MWLKTNDMYQLWWFPLFSLSFPATKQGQKLPKTKKIEVPEQVGMPGLPYTLDVKKSGWAFSEHLNPSSTNVCKKSYKIIFWMH